MPGRSWGQISFSVPLIQKAERDQSYILDSVEAIPCFYAILPERADSDGWYEGGRKLLSDSTIKEPFPLDRQVAGLYSLEAVFMHLYKIHSVSPMPTLMEGGLGPEMSGR